MNKEKYVEVMKEAIERNKKQIIEEIEKNEFVPAQHTLNHLRDLNTQKILMEKIINDERTNTEYVKNV